jgi:hypothetical protein
MMYAESLHLSSCWRMLVLGGKNLTASPHSIGKDSHLRDDIGRRLH